MSSRLSQSEKNSKSPLRFKLTYLLQALLGCSLLGLGFQNCSSNANFASTADKASTIANTPVLPSAGGVSSSSSGGSSASGSGSVLSQNFTLLCSNGQSVALGDNLVTAPAVQLEIVNSANKLVCTINSGNLKNQIISSNSIQVNLSSCSLGAGSYQAFIMDTNNSAAPTNSNSLSNFGFSISSSGDVSNAVSNVEILYDLNSQSTNVPYASSNSSSPFNGDSTTDTQKLCQDWASPLVISLDANPLPIALTAPSKGVFFNIEGENSAPVPNAPIQISWIPAHNNQDYYFLVLPDANGEVRGIDQMFGNNTRGPDGQFAANGYLALAKYDINHAGIISAKDPIYHELRLWKDLNHDGIASKDELFSLSDKGVVSIDLNYDGNFQEVDKWGNKSLYKSVAATADGKLHLVFDLWFVVPLIQ